jgi:hypothetical protein
MTEITNRYASVDLYMPDDLHPIIREYTGANQPFPRLIDAWWIALCLGVRHGRARPLPGPENRVKFMDGTILSSDQWRIIHLELMAVGLHGESILSNPREVIQLASTYANFGLEMITEALAGQNEPTLALMNFLDPITV